MFPLAPTPRPTYITDGSQPPSWRHWGERYLCCAHWGGLSDLHDGWWGAWWLGLAGPCRHPRAPPWGLRSRWCCGRAPPCSPHHRRCPHACASWARTAALWLHRQSSVLRTADRRLPRVFWGLSSCTLPAPDNGSAQAAIMECLLIRWLQAAQIPFTFGSIEPAIHLDHGVNLSRMSSNAKMTRWSMSCKNGCTPERSSKGARIWLLQVSRSDAACHGCADAHPPSQLSH